ncbi:MAG: flagellar basal body protein [Bryobacteraceae bacterium]|nr:flagellar basal body protein [Bryobacteraceae bacterium]
MDLLARRQRLVATNIANADTPGYRTQDLDFHFEYLRASGTPPESRGQPNVVRVEGLLIRNDGNDVSLDREARLLAENALRFSVASQLLRGQFKTLRAAIHEGKQGG